MGKYKVCVYAISKNEEKFVSRWYDSMKEADEIYVLDTGSTDNTVNSLKNLGVHVKKKIIKPWRFDVARNKSLKMLPKNTDICVCTDLDEIFLPGWRDELEKVWEDGIDRCQYVYNWCLDDKNNPKVSFYLDKIHCYGKYKWIYPVHEILKCSSQEKFAKSDKIILNHYPDPTKSRSSYLPLLELSVKEDPENDRNAHYLGREYMYYGMWDKSIEMLKKHLSLNSATWDLERCASMRFIGRCYMKLNDYDSAKEWFDKAVIEAPYVRDPYIERALYNYDLKNYDLVIEDINYALNISKNDKYYINEVFSFNETPYDLLSLCYYYLGNKDKALENIDLALEINPSNERLQANKVFIENM